MKKNIYVLLVVVVMLTGCTGGAFSYEQLNKVNSPEQLLKYGFETYTDDDGVSYTYNYDDSECINNSNACFALLSVDDGRYQVVVRFKSDDFDYNVGRAEEGYMYFRANLNSDGSFGDYKTVIPFFPAPDETKYSEYYAIEEDLTGVTSAVNSDAYDFFNFWDFDRAVDDGYFSKEDMEAYNAIMSLLTNVSGVEVRPMDKDNQRVVPGYYSGAVINDLYAASV